MTHQRGYHPNSVQALAVHRTYLRDRPRCSAIARRTGQPCQRVAVKPKSPGRPGRCISHGGGISLSRPPRPHEAMLRGLRRAERSGLVPDELARHPDWLLASARPKLNARIMLDMLAAWASRDAAAWVRAVRDVVR